MNFPSRPPLNQSSSSRAAIGAADVILGLELTDFWGTVNTFRDQLQRSSRSVLKSGAKTIAISTRDLGIKANYQEFQRYPELDLAVTGDAEATLPSLVEAVKRLVTADRRRALDARRKKLADASRASLERARADAAYAWDASPVTTARLSMEVWEAIKNEGWSLVSYLNPVSGWPMRLWTFDKHYQFIGGAGGGGGGHRAPPPPGPAPPDQAPRPPDAADQPRRGFMYAPGILWTAAHHHIPLLSVMHNN